MDRPHVATHNSQGAIQTCYPFAVYDVFPRRELAKRIFSSPSHVSVDGDEPPKLLNVIPNTAK